ncbi:MAG: anaerobic ribonucleoside-triphosphate reductase activating protein [Lachnospiraceae bacterium]|nr:anaerobic ribonucleoside-triphosphate reductase activating protein [Lachnospiraceae bacterium]
MNYADIKQYDVANGPGIRVSVFVSGCTHYCKGCFNKEAWDFNYGKPFTEETIAMVLQYMEPSYVKGLTILGGEPMEPQNQPAVLSLLKRVREEYPEKSIWMFSGYDFEKDILGYMWKEIPETREIMSCLEVLVDGEFVEELKNLSLRFKGSANQRTILVQESLTSGKVVLYDLERSYN